MGITDIFEIEVIDLHTDDTILLREMWPTDSEGMIEMKTIVPGFYIQRAIHIHVEAHLDWTLAPNGTISSGNRVSNGQIHMNETYSEQIMALEPYASHTTINRTANAEDALPPKSFGNSSLLHLDSPRLGSQSSRGMPQELPVSSHDSWDTFLRALAHRNFSKNNANILKVRGYNPGIRFFTEDDVDVANGVIGIGIALPKNRDLSFLALETALGSADIHLNLSGA